MNFNYNIVKWQRSVPLIPLFFISSECYKTANSGINKKITIELETRKTLCQVVFAIFRNKVKQNNNSSIASDVFKSLKSLKNFWRNNEVLRRHHKCNQSQFCFKHFFPVSLNDLKFYMFYMLAINIQMSLSIVRQKQFQIKWEKSPFM
jgi:hypothetical protein